VPTFKNAKYVWSQEDFDFYKELDAGEKGPANGGSFRDSVLPVVEMGKVQMVKGGAEIEDGLRITPAPGHTPGTVRIEFESQGRKALFCGDILHHAVQVYHPEWNSFACLDQDNARKSRRAAIEHCAGTGAMLLPCHFGAPFHCHIDHKGAGFAPRFADNF
jgi:glyoxylase-like metal-dependent hydrolase (beta-lactamase superfamily II)